jgi:hypothetical protein
MFERRHLLESAIGQLKDCLHYKLIGGFKLASRDHRGRQAVYTTLIKNRDIAVSSRVWPEGVGELLPFWVVRSFDGWKLQKEQVIKFGRLQLTVKDECADPKRRQAPEEEEEEGDVLDLDEKIEESSHIPRESKNEEEKHCRVCYEPEDENHILINPCHCRGSIEFIHMECLRQWLDNRLTKVSLESGNIKVANRNCCELCKMRFPSYILKKGVKMALISFIEQENPFVCFSPLIADQLIPLE